MVGDRDMESKWASVPGFEGRLEKTSTHPIGFVRHERVNPARETKSIHDYFPNAKRISYIQPGAPQAEHVAMFMRGMDDLPSSIDPSWWFGEKIDFNDEANKITLSVDVLDSNNTAIAYSESKSLGSNVTKALVRSIYNEYKIHSLTLRGEIIEPTANGLTLGELSYEVNNSKWEQKIPVLLREMVLFKRKSTRDDFANLKDVVNLQFDDVFKELGGKEHPLVEESGETGADILGKIVTQIPLDDRATFIELVENFPLQDAIQVSLIKEALNAKASSLKDLSEDRVNVAVNIGIVEFIDSLSFDNAFFLADHPLIIKGISNSGFLWEEVDEEYSMHEYKKNTVNQGSGNWREELVIQDKTFKLHKDGDSIVIICSERGKTLWESKIPMNLNSRDIAEIAQNLDADFRKIKDLIPSTFQLAY